MAKYFSTALIMVGLASADSDNPMVPFMMVLIGMLMYMVIGGRPDDSNRQ